MSVLVAPLTMTPRKSKAKGKQKNKLNKISLPSRIGAHQVQENEICSIELMKLHMGGSAAVLGAAKAIGEIKPPGVEVHFNVAACENMISGTGMRPGDVITALNGKTIEVSELFLLKVRALLFYLCHANCWRWYVHVNNTDAEGHLTLADALVYACNQGVDKVGKAAGDKWKSLSDDEKAPYVVKAEKRKVDYEKNMKAYNKKLVNQVSIECQF